MISRFFFLLALCGLVLRAQGHGPLHDPFSYTAGAPLIGQTLRTDYIWLGAGPAPGVQATIDTGSLQYPCMEYASNNRVLIRAGDGPSAFLPFSTPANPTDNFGAISNGTIYFSFALQVQDTNGLGAAGSHFAGLWGGDLPGAPVPAQIFTRVLLRTRPGGYQVGLSKSSGLAADFTWDPRVFSTNDTLFLVGAYVFQANADVSYLWVNPDSTNFCAAAPPATLTNTAGADATQLASFVFMQRAAPFQPAALLADELHIGGAWLEVVAPGCDFSDLPDGPYQTMKARNGPRHQTTPGFRLGLNVSIECDGQPDPLAALDTFDDGVAGLANLHRGETRNISITGGATGELDIYFDWNADGDFQDPGEYLYGASLSVAASIPVTVPMNATLGTTYALFRLSTGGNLGPVGYAPNGEVESYRVQILPPLPPDLVVTVPSPIDPVTHGSNFFYSIAVTNRGEGGATSTTLSAPLPAGVTFTSATASQGSCSNSASGVQCNLGSLATGGSATVSVVGIPDFDQLATLRNIPDSQETIDVTNSITVASVETDATPADNLAVVVVPIVPLRDFGDAPVPPYPTLLPNGARHKLSALRFGVLIDAEPNGLPVNGDDITGLADEVTDGFGLPGGGFYAGGFTPINIQVSGAGGGYIDMWFDLDGVAGWGAADHVVVAFFHPGGGATVPVPVAIPPGAATGLRWARARLHKNPAGLPTTGYGGPGEVVDFQVNVLAAAVDLVVAEPVPIEVTEDDPLTLTLTVSNKGPSIATGTILEVHFPPGATLDGLQLSQGTGQMEGTNLVCHLGTLAPNTLATVTFTAGTSNIFDLVGDEFYDWCFWLYSVEPELNPADNTHHGLVRVVAKRDFGDAPDVIIGPAYNYPTRLVDNGARHRIVGPYFGGSPAGVAQRDPDPDGAPTLNADGDDLLDANDDEEGIQFLDPIYPGATGVRVRINAPLGGKADAWIDFNRNGQWSVGAPEQVFTSLTLTPGTFNYLFNVPAGAVLGSTYARFRVSSQGGLSTTGYATNGEVQDLKLDIVQMPAPPDLVVTVPSPIDPVTHSSNFFYSIAVTNRGEGGATSTTLSAPLPAGFTFTSATPSQGSCSNSASGVQCNLGSLAVGGSATVSVVGIPDFNQLATLRNIPDSQETIDVTNSITVASAETDATPADNLAVVVVAAVPLRDFGDAPIPIYPTMLPGGARHRLGALRFGTLIDAEPNGQPVNLDDVIGGNDEVPDGIGLLAAYYAGGLMPITFQVNGPAAYVDLWVDLDGAPGWSAADHVLIAAAHPGGGAVVGYAIPIPFTTAPGPVWARARVHLNPAGLTAGGYGGPGEVVDFPVNILPGAIDLVVAEPAPIEVTEGDPLTLTLTVSNKGPSIATSAILEIHFPPGATLDGFQASQGTGQMEGTNLVVRLGTLAPNALASVTFTAGTSNIFDQVGDEFMDYCWGLYAVEPELNPADNMHHGLVRVVAKRDFGDAPDLTLGPAYQYPTHWMYNGARHRMVGPYFGGSPAGVANRDADSDGMPTLNADGDDLIDVNDDEEGVQILDPIYPGATDVRVRINAPAGGKVEAWIDFNRDGLWNVYAPEQIFTSLPVVAGTFDYTFDVPAGAMIGSTYARFRISSMGGLGTTGYATDGEVQDLKVNIVLNPVVVFGGLEHVSVGNATVTLGSNGLNVANLNSSNDVVRVNLGRAEGWRADVGLIFGPTMDCTIYTTRGSIGGQSNQVLHTVQIDRHGSNVTVVPNFAGIGANQCVTEFYDRNGVLLRSRAPAPSGSPFFFGLCPPGTRAVCHIEVFADSIYILVCDCVEIPGLSTNVPGGIIVKMSAVTPAVSVESINAVDLGGADGTSFTVSNESIKQGGYWHQAVGNTRFQNTTQSAESALAVGNIGASGQDGLLTELGGADAQDVTLDPVDLKAAGRVFRVSANGQAGGSNGPLATLEVAGDENALRMTFTDPIFLTNSLVAWNGAQQVVNQLPVNSGAAMTLTPEQNGTVALHYFGVFKDEQNRLVMELEFAQPVRVTPAGGVAVSASRVRYITTGAIGSVGSVLQNWSGLGSFVFNFFGRDYGDAPTGYPVLPVENGARHRWWPNWKLGANWDRDFVVAHSANADWDDLHSSLGLPAVTDDEDGVVFLATLGGILVQVTAAHDGYLNAWMDFNRDTDWADAGEQVITDAALVAGVPQNFTITVPGGTTAGQFFSRWRLSETPGLSYSGYGGKGEVEDHVCNWTPETGGTNDFGDAPDNYKTYDASGGPKHLIVAGEYLGLMIDGEADGQPVDLDGADEDGVSFPAVLTPGTMAMLNVTASVAGKLDGFIDFNHNGMFDTGAGSPEPVCVAVPLAPGANAVSINVPAGAVAGGTWARFRFSLAGGLPPGGPAPDGEVEDYGPDKVIIGSGNPNPVDLAVTIAPATVQVIETGYFTSAITVSNKGPSTATGVQLTSAIPSGLTVISISNSAGSCSVQGSNIVCTVSNLAAQQSFIVTLTANASLLPNDLSEEFWCVEWPWFTGSAEPELTPADNQARLALMVFVQRDFGDAPAPPYPTLLPNGARHRLGMLKFGDFIDAELDGLPVNLDDITGVADEITDGFGLPPGFYGGGLSPITIQVTGAAGYIDLWIDQEGVPGWSAADHVLGPVFHPGGGAVVGYMVPLPAGAVTGMTWARARVGLNPAGLSPTGYGGFGEVVDFQVSIVPTVAEPILFADLSHVAVGGAALTVSSNGLQISNLGSNGQGGVSIDLRERSRTASLGFGSNGFTLPGLAKLAVAAYGTVSGTPDQFLGAVRFENSNGIVRGFADYTYPSFQSRRIEVYNGMTLVGTYAVSADGSIGTLSGDGRLTDASFVAERGRDAFWCYDGWWYFSPPGQPSMNLMVTQIRLEYVGSADQIDNLARLDVTGSDIDSITIQQENAPRFQPRLRMGRAGHGLKLNWDTRSTVLQSAPTVNGPWTNVAEGTNSIGVVPGGGNGFYRLFQSGALDLPQLLSPKRNVLLFIADDVGVDQIGMYVGYYGGNGIAGDNIAVDSTIAPTGHPNLWRLATAGVTFINACSSPTCSPTRAGFYTGRCSFRHGVYSPTRPNLPATETTIAQVLQASGYTSGLFGKWHLGDPTATMPGLRPLSFGWNRHYGVLGGEVQPSYYGWNKVEDTTAIGVIGSSHYPTKENVDDALDWISAQNDPWMATVAFNAPHWAMTSTGVTSYEMPPSAYATRTDDGGRGTYRSMLEYVDIEIGRMLSSLPSSVLEKTTVIFMGDNGTEGRVSVGSPATTVTISSHFPAGKNKGTLYAGGVEVPMIIADGYVLVHGQAKPLTLGSLRSDPGHVASPGRFETNLVQTMDLFATIAAIGHGDDISGNDSVSLLPYLNSSSASPQRDYAFAENRQSTWAACGNTGWSISIRNHAYKLHVIDYGSTAETYELYDLSTDRWENTNLWSASPTAAQKTLRDTFRAAIDAWLGSTYACPRLVP